MLASPRVPLGPSPRLAPRDANKENALQDPAPAKKVKKRRKSVGGARAMTNEAILGEESDDLLQFELDNALQLGHASESQS